MEKNNRTKKPWLICMILAVMFIMSVAGCGSKSAASAAVTEAAVENAVSMDSASDIVYGDGDEEALSVALAEQAEVEEAGGLTAENMPQGAVPDSRKLIRTIDISAETMEFDELITRINKKIEALGGYAEESRISGRRFYSSGQPDARSASITARIPADQTGLLVTEVEANSNITERSENTSDITLQYADLESRKKSLAIEQERVWALLEKAEDIEAVITLETRLTDIRYELENMESSLRLYDNQVTYSTVNLSIEEVISLTPDPEAPAVSAAEKMKRGFNKSFRNVTEGMVNFFIAFVSGLPYIVILAAVIGIVLLAGRRFNRVHNQRSSHYSRTGTKADAEKSEEKEQEKEQ